MCPAAWRTDRCWELTAQHRELSSVLCGDLDGAGGGGGLGEDKGGGPKERGDVCVHIADSLHH